MEQHRAPHRTAARPYAAPTEGHTPPIMAFRRHRTGKRHWTVPLGGASLSATAREEFLPETFRERENPPSVATPFETVYFSVGALSVTLSRSPTFTTPSRATPR